ncbi:MAG TPA: 16S rRNA (cytosine(967)-C(5))-methyltransferase RsmB [Gemmatimonadaceae bacterium]|nr:16S rRNA (cytosine(967)-C(5))-methyltransferase RsmB [Gemmatimonadaceae bacterium]
MNSRPPDRGTPSRGKGRWAPGAETLASAARAVARIALSGRSAEDALASFESAPDRAAIRAITLGTVRWYLRLAPAIEPLLERPERLAPELRALLVSAAHQIEYSRNPAHSTVDAAVDGARILNQERAAGLANAVLRRFAREKEALFAKADRELATRVAHPRWLVDQLRAAWPEQFERVLEANNAHPPMVLRVDLNRVTVADYVAQLAPAGIVGHAIAWAPAAIHLEQPVPVSLLPGFNDGLVSVQDAGAQLAAPLLDCRRGMRVLDACAAPGGKTTHVLELTPDLAELVAVDVDARRMRRVQENLERLRRSATLKVADIREPKAFWDERPFDRILLDAPCSSTGVIRRHPDIKLLRRAQDIPALADTQRALLASCFQMLAPGGRLLYSTCTVLPPENEGVLAEFLRAERQARLVPVALASQVPGSAPRPLGVQLLPGEAGTDGFHYACVEKTTDGT